MHYIHERFLRLCFVCALLAVLKWVGSCLSVPCTNQNLILYYQNHSHWVVYLCLHFLDGHKLANELHCGWVCSSTPFCVQSTCYLCIHAGFLCVCFQWHTSGGLDSSCPTGMHVSVCLSVLALTDNWFSLFPCPPPTMHAGKGSRPQWPWTETSKKTKWKNETSLHYLFIMCDFHAWMNITTQ